MSDALLRPFAATTYDFAEAGVALNWIGGAFVPAAGGGTLAVENPRLGREMGRVVLSEAVDVEAAVDAASAAFPRWRATPLKERGAILDRLKRLMERDLDEISWLCSHENGKIYAQAKASVLKGVECLELGCALPNMVAGGQLDVSRGVSCRTTHEPLGVVAGVVPFNFPAMVPMWTLPQMLIAGNTVVLKPSEAVPFTLRKIAVLAHEAGLPPGVLNLVNGGQRAVEALVDHPTVKALSFVGSTRVARLLYARGAALGKRMLCMGGAKNHLVMVPDADLELTAQNVAASAFGCAGQRCMAASTLIAVGDTQGHIDALCQRAREIALGADMGPVISAAAKTRVEGYISAAEVMGGAILVDGRGANMGDGGHWVGPTVIDGAQPTWPAACEEIFGPVLTILRVATLDEAIAIENASAYGNAASIYTQSGYVADYAARRFEAGMIGINIGVPVPREPFSFGGWNDSKFGHGDITGVDGFRFFSRTRKVTTKWAGQQDSNWMS